MSIDRGNIPLRESVPSILIIDDNDDLRDMLSALLESEGFRVVAASGGFEALDYLEGGLRPALILLDVMMPRMSGVELLVYLRRSRDHAETPVVLMSGSSPEDVPPRTCVLRKPFELDHLLDIVRSHCRSGSPPSIASYCPEAL